MRHVLIADILFVQNGRGLLVQQKKTSAYGLWSLTGGHVELGESPLEAIKREVKEELGFALQTESILHSLTHIELQTSEGGLEVTTFVAPLTDRPLNIQEDELIGFAWFTPGEIKSIAKYLRSPWILPMAKQYLT